MLPFLMNDAAVASGQAFLVGELEKRKQEINMPLSSFTWMRDIPFEMGGGAIEFVSNMFAEFATAGTNEDGIVNAATNVIPVIQANLSKDLSKVFPWMNNLRMTFLDVMKLQQTGRSLDPVLDAGLRLAWNKTLDKCVYTGFTVAGTTGLINNASVSAGNVALNAAGTSRLWVNKTADEILNDFNEGINAAWAAAEYAENEIVNQVNISPAKFAYINATKVSQAADKSILTYLLENNLARSKGVDLKIESCRQCIGAGSGPTDRMVFYLNRKDRVEFDITIPLTKGLTSANVEQAAYLTNYFGFFSELQVKATQTILYRDGY